MSEEYSEALDFKEHRQLLDSMETILHPYSIPNTAEVLDVGGGQGMHACFLASKYKLCWCLDVVNYQSLYNGEFYRLFKEKCERNSVHYKDNQLRFIESDAMDMLFRDGYFDFVTSFNAFEHIPDPGKALNEMLRVTKTGGIIYITFDPIWTADTGSHFIHRVPDPWAHLVLSQNEFIQEMKNAGASEGEISDFTYGMNHVRLARYKEILASAIDRDDVDLLHESSWLGLAQENYRYHMNYSKSLHLGYTEEELNIRGMCYVLQKREC